MLGLYSDDWWSLVEPIHGTAPFSLDRLIQFVGVNTGYASRPVLGLFAFLMSSLLGSSAIGFQWASGVLVLLAALSLRSWLRRLLPESPAYYGLAADWATIFWMVMPWMVAVTAWPVMSHTILAQIFFTEAARMLPLRGPLTTKVALRFTFLLIASALSYEAFYFQIFPVIALCALSPLSGNRDKRTIIGLASLSCLAQAFQVVLNRYIARLNPASSKTFNPHWKSTFLSNLHALLGLKDGLREYGSLWFSLCLLFAACATCLVVIGFIRRTHRTLVCHITLIELMAITGLGISALIYSVAGYGFTFAGMQARTLFSPSWSLTIGFFGLLVCFFVQGNVILRSGLVLSAVGIVLAMVAAQHAIVEEWAHVWLQERNVLAATPIAEIRQLPRDSAILYVGPSYYRDIVVFGASWDLTAAAFAMPGLSENRRPHQGLTTIYPATKLYKWDWDGSYLRQNCPGYWIQKYPAKHLYVWDYTKSHFYEVPPQFAWPPP